MMEMKVDSFGQLVRDVNSGIAASTPELQATL
jgi:hypothetical protein